MFFSGNIENQRARPCDFLSVLLQPPGHAGKVLTENQTEIPILGLYLHKTIENPTDGRRGLMVLSSPVQPRASSDPFLLWGTHLLEHVGPRRTSDPILIVYTGKQSFKLGLGLCEVLTEPKSGAASWEYSLFNPAWKVDTKTKLNKYSENLVAAHSREGGRFPSWRPEPQFSESQEP